MTEMHLVSVGAYSESDPEGNATGDYWYEDLNISQELDSLEERAKAEGLAFVRQADGTTPVVCV